MSRALRYGSWPSPISASLITAGVTGLSALSATAEALFFIESRPEEAGRNALVMVRDGRKHELTPPPFSVRTRVHEYGGGAYVAAARAAFFVDFSDQNLYRVDYDGGPPVRITSTGIDTRYADFVLDEQRARLIAVGERPGAREPENYLVAIDIATGAATDLHRGHDFYAAPRLSPDGRKLCFLTWDHPNMPWDGTELRVASFDSTGALEDAPVIAGGSSESIVQPEWLDARRVAFASDRSGWWNLYRYEAGAVQCLRADDAEYAGPAWTFGSAYFRVVDAQRIVAERMAKDGTTLGLLDVATGRWTPLATPAQAFSGLALHANRVFFIGGGADRLAWIGSVGLDGSQGEVVATAGALPVDARWFSRPEPIEYPSRDGNIAHAYFYAPRNPDAVGPAGERPPLLVMSHGGPTAATSPLVNLRIQYYTSRGWAVADVDYGGSSGYGRAYRARLDGRWGVVDVQDCEDVVTHLARLGRVDAERAAIRGGSAGGYTTLAALTFGSAFKAGASHYGIGDLEMLASDTHKFESRYLDRLVGPYPKARELYRERSPIHHVERLRCPVVFFQGLEDRVVPPSQAEAMVEALRRRRVPVAYVAFPGEQHGFRQAANIKRALEGEYLFFARVFGFAPAEELPPLEIEFLS